MYVFFSPRRSCFMCTFAGFDYISLVCSNTQRPPQDAHPRTKMSNAWNNLLERYSTDFMFLYRKYLIFVFIVINRKISYQIYVVSTNDYNWYVWTRERCMLTFSLWYDSLARKLSNGKEADACWPRLVEVRSIPKELIDEIKSESFTGPCSTQLNCAAIAIAYMKSVGSGYSQSVEGRHGPKRR